MISEEFTPNQKKAVILARRGKVVALIDFISKLLDEGSETDKNDAEFSRNLLETALFNNADS